MLIHQQKSSISLIIHSHVYYYDLQDHRFHITTQEDTA